MRGVRKLACVSIGYSLAVFAAHYLIPIGALYIISATAVGLAAAGLFLKDRARLRVILIALAFAVGLSGYRIHYDRTVLRCEELSGTVRTVRVELEDYVAEHDYGLSVRVKILDADMPQVCMLVYDYGKSIGNAKPGDILTAQLKLRSSAVRYGKESDSNISDDVYLIGTVDGECELEYSTDKPLRYLPQRLGKLLRDNLRDIFPDDVRGFMLALMTGDKTEYYLDDELYTSMSMAGLSHVVAVSGMHVSFLVAFLQLILGKNRRTSLMSLAFIWLFVTMSGASPSATRAGIMLSVYLVAPVVNRENDKLTALSLALAIILAANPFSAGSISLQLSFAAMAGILAFTEPIFNYIDGHTPKFKLKRLKLYVNGALSNSLAVSAFTIPILAARFGSIALLSPIANILCLWAVSALFVGGYVICIIGFAWKTAAIFLAGILAYLVRYIALAVKFIARLKFAQLYTQNLYAAMWVVFSYILFAASYLTRDRNKSYSPLLPAVLSIAALISVFVWTDIAMKNDGGTIAVMDVGNGQCIALTQGEHTAVIDCGSSGTAVNAGTELSDYLHSLGRTKIDCILLTHLHSDHASGVVRLMGLTDVDTLILPERAEENADEGLLGEILAAAEKYGVKLRYIGSDTELKAGDMTLSVYSPYPEGDKNERGLMLSAKVGGNTLLVTGDVSQSTERKLTRDRDLSGTDILIAGHHGSKYSTSEELLEEARPETAVISVGYNSYGHPTDEVLYRLSYYGADIYRTDLSGRIVITGSKTEENRG